VTPAEDLELEARVTREVRRFDLRPLLTLLADRGYAREDILFQSASEGTSSTLVEAIEFHKRPSRHVLITLNVGLLGDNTLLPSYFFQMIEKSAAPERFYDFLRFFDHRLIESYLRAVYPEEDEAAYRDWSRTVRSFFKMLGLGSVSTLDWLARVVFPDLGTSVSRRAFAAATASHAFRTGQSALDGTGILGKTYESDASGFVLDLLAEEEVDGRGRAWPAIVRKRLNERLLPLLAPHRIPLLVRLHVLFHASWVRVDFPATTEHGFLGYERIRGDADAGHTLLIYRGVTGERLSA
jgi:hypothetical protein